MGRRKRTRAQRSAASPSRAERPAPSDRYTPPAKIHVRIRPTWHKVIGALLIVAGAAIVIIHYSANILPGGHQDAYLLLGFAIAASSSWWFGAFDRQPSPEEIRRAYANRKR